jgi:hypothetical protein
LIVLKGLINVQDAKGKLMKILCLDNGLYPVLCEALSDGGKNEVRYFTPWAKPFPSIDDRMKGDGYGDLKKTLHFFDHVKEADMIVNFDVPSNDMISYLREQYKDKSIFGAGRGERLEHDRLFLKEWLEHYNLPVGPYKVVKGITALINYLKTNPDKWVKTNIFRDDLETFYFTNWDDDKYLLSEIEVTLGMLAETYTFIVEDSIPCKVQSGSDMFFANGRWIPFSWGFEINKNLCVNKVITDIEDLPVVLQKNIDYLQGLMRKMDYRGAVSTEERITDKDTAYLIDFTARVPAPLGQMYPVFINNWPELCYKIGRNEEVEVDCDFDYIGAFALSSEHAKDHNLKIIVDEAHLKDVRFQMVAQNKDGYFAVKGNTGVCVLVAGGDSPQEVLYKIKAAGEYVDSFGLDKDDLDGIQEQYDRTVSGLKGLNMKF